MPCDSVLHATCGLGWFTGELRNTRFSEFASRDIFLHDANLPSTRAMEPHFLGELGPDSAMPVPAQYEKLRRCKTAFWACAPITSGALVVRLQRYSMLSRLPPTSSLSLVDIDTSAAQELGLLLSKRFDLSVAMKALEAKLAAGVWSEP
jgi:hypothetical protein